MAYHIHGGAQGNVGGSHNQGVVHVGQGAAPGQRGDQGTSRPVLVIVAKDQEMRALRDYLARVPYVASVGTGQEVAGILPVRYRIRDKISMVVACLNGQGVKKVRAVVPDLLRTIKPFAGSTVGICGSAPHGYGARNSDGTYDDDQQITASHVSRVMIITQAKLMQGGLDEPGKVESVSCTVTSADQGVQLWRQFPDVFLRPPRATGGFSIVTVPTDDCPDEPALTLSARLQSTSCDGQDMEIGAIWKCCHSFDPYHTTLKVLPAFKAISDFGNGAERKAKEQDALINACGALVQFLDALETDQQFFSGT